MDIEPHEKRVRKFPKKFLIFGLVSVVVAMGGAVGALISLNSGGGQTTELGTGVLTTTACDSAITYTPQVSYFNDGANSRTVITEVDLSDISAACAGKDFLLTIRGSDGKPLALSNDSSGRLITSVHFYFQKFTGADGTVDENGKFTNGLTHQFELLGPDAVPTATRLVTVRAIHDLESIATNPDPLDLSQPDRYWALSAEHNDVAIVFNPSPLDSGASSLTGFVSPLQSIIFTLETSDH